MTQFAFRKLEFSTEKEEKLLEKKKRTVSKSDSEKLTTWGFRKVAVGSALVCSYGIGVFVIQIFYMSQKL